jgi:hypothetical protein
MAQEETPNADEFTFDTFSKYMNPSTAKTYRSFVKDLDLKTALIEPSIIAEMLHEQRTSDEQIARVFKALKCIAKITVEHKLLKDGTVNESLLNNDVKTIIVSSKKKTKEIIPNNTDYDEDNETDLGEDVNGLKENESVADSYALTNLSAENDELQEKCTFLVSLVKEVIPHVAEPMKTRLTLLFFEKLKL